MTNSELLKKYNVPGPRYTSYPTVPYWENSPTEEQWISALSDTLRTSKDVGAALYLHIPFCESLCTYCGCNTRITRNHGVASPYLETLIKEFELYREKLTATGALNGKLLLSELHLGGGTPTFLTPDELAFLLGSILEHCMLTKNHELSIEIDPRVTTRTHLETLARFGFKRVSLGIQDFDPIVQDIVHRVQSFEQVDTLTKQARELGFTSINYDLIYGLPLQTIQSVEKTIQKVIQLRPDRIAYYGYAHVPWIKAAQRRFTEDDLPSGDQKRVLYERGRELLEKAGYREIGMDHFALEADPLFVASKSGGLHRNFMGYTSRNVTPIIALGVSSIGDAWTAFAQNEKLLETYTDRVKKNEIPIFRGHVLNEEDLTLRKHILNLMTTFHTNWEKDELKTNYLKGISDKLRELERDHLVKISSADCMVTEEGRPFLRNVCMAFDARLARKVPDTKLFSKTV